MSIPYERTIVFDLETQKAFNEVDRSKPHLLKVSVLGAYDYSASEYLMYEEKELPQFEERLKKAELVVGFNIRSFDLPVLQPYLGLDVKTLPVLDLLVEIEKVLGHRVSLQSLAQATLGEGKSGSGLQAIELFREGKMEELKAYCRDDVKITKNLYEYGLLNGKVSYRSNRDYQTHTLEVDWASHAPQVPPQETFPSGLF
ncbi:MAG: ribonuclease H-like domain-containing protein [Candidatus Omnitrophica bacterium]|nr:ribonuclease H-like domain-containing protein [Candidatus Omnitrophota bacterium]